MATKDYPTERGLDGIFYRVERDGKYVNRCFTDLTADEQNEFLSKYDASGLKRMCLLLAETVRALGDQFDIMRADSEEESDNDE